MQKLDIHRLRNCAKGTCWDVGNKVLYDLCRKYPRHDNQGEILAKIWIIGRSYAAAIERRPKSRSTREKLKSNGEKFYESVVGPTMRGEKIDSWLMPLRDFKKPSFENANQIIGAHKKLTDVFYRITGHEKRSLASKYLHFHFPNLFYLYDSRAAREISKVARRTKRVALLTEHDKVYAAYFLRCLELVTSIRQQERIYLTPRELDNYLLGFGQ